MFSGFNTIKVMPHEFTIIKETSGGGGEGGDELGDWDWHIYINMYKMDN